MELIGIHSHGWIHFALHRNPGAMLGLFSNLPAFLRVVTLSTGGAFLVVTYALIQYLLPLRSLILRSGMSVLLGGILGNVTDRILWGSVVDFIILGQEGGFLSPAFNLADALQWVGYGMIVYAIVRDGEILWPENNSRRRYWVNVKFQLKYCYILLSVGFSVSLICAVFSYTYLRVSMIELVGPNSQILDRFLVPFAITFGVVCVSFSVVLFAVGKVISHKVAGPIYAFEKFMEEVLVGRISKDDARSFKLRSHDEFRELEDLAHRLRERLIQEPPEVEPPPPNPLT